MLIVIMFLLQMCLRNKHLKWGVCKINKKEQKEIDSNINILHKDKTDTLRKTDNRKKNR